VIDLHCHLLPGIDDGPPNIGESLALARAAAAAGTRTIVATPHIDHTWSVSPEDVPDAVERFQAALHTAHIDLEVLPGGEIEFSRLPELRPQQIDAVRLGVGPWILLESPLTAAAGDFHGFVKLVRRRGERILLAHPERSPGFQRRPERLAELVGDGVLTSLTSGALLGRFGGTVRAFALDLLRDGLVHDIASDSHDAGRRGPELLAGLLAAERDVPGVLAQADWMTREVPAAILAGGDIPPAPDRPRRGSRLRRLLVRGGLAVGR
jgi:protein-tyrosine phosphatase